MLYSEMKKKCPFILKLGIIIKSTSPHSRPSPSPAMESSEHLIYSGRMMDIDTFQDQGTRYGMLHALRITCNENIMV